MMVYCIYDERIHISFISCFLLQNVFKMQLENFMMI
jgi:hypothetical protein